MHTMHCARNITLCRQCNEPIPKSQFAEHEKSCRPPKPKKPVPPPSLLEQSSYFQTRKAIEDKKTEARKERYMQRMDRLVDTGYSFKQDSPSVSSSTSSIASPPFGYSRQGSYDYPSKFQNDTSYSNRSRDNRFNFPDAPNKPETKRQPPAQPQQPQEPPGAAAANFTSSKYENKSSGMLACKYCDLELPKLELDDHENYCGSRTDKCMECGELVMFKDKQAHMASNHGNTARRINSGKLWLAR